MRRALAMGLGLLAGTVAAGEVQVEGAAFERGAGGWQVSVTLRHADAGWEHYADAWRVLDADGTELGRRILHHPHEHEQPFTRSLSRVSMPAGAGGVWVQGHDTVHGWGPKRYFELPGR